LRAGDQDPPIVAEQQAFGDFKRNPMGLDAFILKERF
jgi:hypothetical protein